MVFGVILASGIGSRMKMDIPKQFIELEGVPIIAYTIFSLVKATVIDKIIIVNHPDYIDFTREIIATHFAEEDIKRITIIGGGKERIDSIDNAVSHVVNTEQISDEDIILFHDAVRPFISQKIIKDSINGALKYGATVAGLSVVDTMLVSKDGKRVDYIPDRSTLFNGQSPDTFRLAYFIELRSNISDEDKKSVFGTSKICELNNKPIFIIPGDEMNFKITTPSDLKKAQFYLKSMREDDYESFKFARSRRSKT